MEFADENPTATRVVDPGIRTLYKLETRWQSWLDVEAALALAQSRVGVVPTDAAKSIAASAQLELLDRSAINEGTRRTGHALVPLVWELARVAGEDAGKWVHWGATSQNIMITGDLLVLRKAHDIFLGLIARIINSLSDLAEQSAEMPLPARSHGQHAVPITFGFKIAVWIDELIRHCDRLRQAEPRVFIAMFGGAAGTFATLEEKGPAILDEMGKILNMTPMSVPVRSVGDHFAEYVCLLAIIGSTCGKIGGELFTLMKTEFGEVEEPIPAGTVGSSTMPQKRNPRLCQDIIAGAAKVRSVVPLALEAMQIEHEADRTKRLMMAEAIEHACISIGDVLARLDVLAEGLRLNPERMRRNLELTGGLIMAEAIMLKIGKTIGRQRAHDLVYELAQIAAVEGRVFAELLARDERVAAHIPPGEIASMLDPLNYTGLSAHIARAAAGRGRKATSNNEATDRGASFALTDA